MDEENLTKGELTGREIVRAAYTLFVKNGYHGTSMRKIAAEAGIALGGIYNHFTSKEEIFEAVFQTYHPYNRIIPSVQEAHGDTVEEFLRDIARHLVEGLKQDPHFLNLMFIDIVEFHSNNNQRLVEKQLSFFAQIYQRVIDIPNSRVRSIPPLILARSFFGLFFSYFITGIVLGNKPSLAPLNDESVFERFIDIFLHGILLPGEERSKEETKGV